MLHSAWASFRMLHRHNAMVDCEEEQFLFRHGRELGGRSKYFYSCHVTITVSSTCNDTARRANTKATVSHIYVFLLLLKRFVRLKLICARFFLS